MWLLFTLLSAVLLATRRVLEKQLSGKVSFFTIGWAAQFFCLPLAVLLLFFTPIPSFSSLPVWQFWLPLMIIWLVLYPLQTHFYFKSIHEAELSLVLPLLSLIPVFNVLISLVLLKELPSILGFAGIFCILAGVFVLNKKTSLSLKIYIQEVIAHKASIYMLITAGCIATGSTLDKLAITASNPLFYNFVNTFGAAVSLFTFATLRKQNELHMVKKHVKVFALIGAVYSICYVLYLLALQTGLVTYVVAVRSTNVLIASMFGVIFLGERREKKKTIAFTMICIGLLLISQA